MRKRGDLDVMELAALGPVRGEVELVADGEHLDRVIRDGVLKATVSVDIATADFKAMLVPPRKGGAFRGDAPSIVWHLAELARRGVEVRVLHAGVPSAAALQELKQVYRERYSEPARPRAGGSAGDGRDGGPGTARLAGRLAGRLTFRRCPRLHSKAVIVDARRVYLGSANLTGAGLGAKGATRRNFELGVLSETPALVDAVLQRFNALWEGEPCVTCGRRDVCPVPLEEPRL